MIVALRAFFFRLSTREKVLLVLFVWVLVALGLFGASADLRARLGALKTAGSELDNQAMYLGMREELGAQLASSSERFDPTKTLGASALQGRVDRLAREAGVTLQGFDYRRGQQNDIYDLHELRVNIRGITYDQLYRFDLRLQAEAPYLKLESIRVSADRRDRERLDCTLILSSFEMKQRK